MFTLRTALLALASAVAVSADYYIDPNSVELTTRRFWCNNQLSSCPIICAQTAPPPVISNTCDPEFLTYGCVCSDGLQPNLSEYSQTLPFHTCQQWGQQCVKACGSDNTCSSSCRQDHPCGAQNPTKVTATLTTADPATATGTGSSSTGPAVFEGLDGSSSTGSSASTPPGSGASALEFGKAYGLAVVGASLFAGFALGL
ncbi:hypothetical protein QBC39DRAFT_343089 [Podospora conica]|nr:hypothetical protein QBC39DRAFT_343089 [Schizothecium conicum]